MRTFILAALVAAAPGLLAAGPAAATADGSVFDRAAARDYCAAGPADEAEHCLSDQETAARRIDRWIDRGDLPRYLSRRTYANCQAVYGPDLRRTWLCIEDRQDDRRNGRGGVLSGQGITFGR